MIPSHSRLLVLTCGSPGDGKSTLIGRLVQGRPVTDDNESLFVFASLLNQGQGDALVHRCLSTERREFVLADTTDHERYTRSVMAAGANADAAVLLVDARSGIVDQTRRDTILASLLAVAHIVLAVNKMDLVGYDEHVFESTSAAFTNFARELTFKTVQVIPVSALESDNLSRRSEHMPWYAGPCLLACLENLEPEPGGSNKPFRMPVQSANCPSSGFAVLIGTIASGTAQLGDEVTLLPSGRTTSIKGLCCDGADVYSARAGAAVVLTIADEADASPGDMLVAPRARPQIADQFAAHLVWMSQRKLLPGRSYLINLNANAVPASVTDLKYLLDVKTLARNAAKTLAIDEVGVCNLAVARPVAFDSYADNRATGAFVLIDRYSNETVAAGMIDFALRRATNIHYQQIVVSKNARSELKKHQPAVLWFTGLSGAGKSTIANCVEAALHGRSAHTIMLDGDNVRHALNKDLGFTEADRVENIRRIGEVAKLMSEAGLIVLCSFISPFRAERRMVRELLPPGEFIEIFVDTPIEECMARDAKGLYRRALAGEIKNFTGVDQPYEVPEFADLHLHGDRERPEVLADRVIAHLCDRKILKR
jgi:bifunctional enzyme CysN/CysC